MWKGHEYKCEVCEKVFFSKRKNVRFCSNSCRATKMNKNRKPHNFIEEKIRYCITCGKKLHHQTRTGYCTEHYITSDYKTKLSDLCKNNGGYQKGSGQGKHGWYKGIWCDSSWELAWVIYHLEHQIHFERNTQRFTYTFENKTHYYIPDYKMNDYFIEIKGYITEQVKEKIKQFPHKLKVLQKEDMQEILEYVHNKYGNDFIKLYE